MVDLIVLAEAHGTEHQTTHSQSEEHATAPGDVHAQDAAHTGSAAGEDTHGGSHEVHGLVMPEMQNFADYVLGQVYKNDKDFRHNVKVDEKCVDKPGKPCKTQEVVDLHKVHNHTLVSIVKKNEKDHDAVYNLMGISWLDVINIFFAFAIGLTIIVLARKVTKKLQRIPQKGQAFFEVYTEWLQNHVESIMGEHSKPFIPFIASIFTYIIFMNYTGLVPLLKAPEAVNINVPIALALCVFFYVEYYGIKKNGLGKYLLHFKGDGSGIKPLDWFFLYPMNIITHVIGELSKPLTLAFRLFGNITAEDVVMASFIILSFSLYVVPIQTVFYPLALLFGFIQALVFASLSAAYILLMLPHEEHH